MSHATAIKASIVASHQLYAQYRSRLRPCVTATDSLPFPPLYAMSSQHLKLARGCASNVLKYHHCILLGIESQLMSPAVACQQADLTAILRKLVVNLAEADALDGMHVECCLIAHNGLFVILGIRNLRFPCITFTFPCVICGQTHGYFRFLLAICCSAVSVELPHEAVSVV